MPKVHDTIKQRCDELRQRLSVDYMSQKTSIFKDPIGDKRLDEYTRDKIKDGLKVWIDSWIKDELDELLKK